MSPFPLRRLPLLAGIAACASAFAAPPVVTPPQSVQVQLGQSASFTVAASGAGPFSYHWYHWGTDGQVASIDRCDTSATCTIAAVTEADAGEYNVEVYDTNGEHAHGDPRATLTIVDGDEIAAASCNRADVQSAIDQIPAGESGTVRIPAGTCDWGTGLIVVDDKSAIRIRGAGRDLTMITRSGADDSGVVLSDSEPAAIFTFDCRQGQLVDVSGIHFKGPVDGNGHLRTDRLSRGLELRGHCANFRIHDARFSKFSYVGLLVKGKDSRGVIYGNEFLDNWRNGLGYAVSVQGWSSNFNQLNWPPFEPGSANAVFIEDNYFSGQRHNIASHAGARYVFRHNELVAWRTNSERNASLLQTFQDGQIDAHGVTPVQDTPWDEQPFAGSRSWEVYDNLFTMADDSFIPQGGSAESRVAAAGMRGGNGMFFCNRFDRAAHGGTLEFTEPLVSFEGNDECHNFSYPAPFQIGFQGKSFFWNNSGDVRNGGNASPNTYMDDGTCYPRLIMEGRDYYNRAPLAEDDDEFGTYSQYQPYPYPHPLRNEVIFLDRFEPVGPTLSCSAGRHGTPTASAASPGR